MKIKLNLSERLIVWVVVLFGGLSAVLFLWNLGLSIFYAFGGSRGPNAWVFLGMVVGFTISFVAMCVEDAEAKENAEDTESIEP